MDDASTNLDDLASAVVDAGSYSLSQVDIDRLFGFMAFLGVVELFQLAVLVIVSGLIFGALVTRKWTV